MPLEPTLARMRARRRPADGRVLALTGAAIATGLAAALAAQALTRLIALVTNLAFYARWSTLSVGPSGHHLGVAVVLVPAAGGIVVGLLARFGSPAIRGHGIPEAMEQVLFNESRIAPRMTVLKPLSAAIAIGTGGPFGAEGPIIATGGALGSLVGQLLPTTADERKTLLAAGAAAGMAATFGSPVAAVILAIELLLFELRPRSVVPVALAAAAAAALRTALGGESPVFAVPALIPTSPGALAVHAAVGALLGVAAVGITRAVYAVEDTFARLPLPWMCWPALGGLAVGAIGLVAPHTLGVGYDNIERLAAGEIVGQAAATLVLAKTLSWMLALGSGTSGGTLAPLLTIGAGAGALLARAAADLLPGVGIDPHTAALVGMAALFAGASRALLTTIIFVLETTGRVEALLPVLAGTAAAHLVSCLLARDSIMTAKLTRRGARVPSELGVDPWERLRVRDVATRPAVTLAAEERIGAVRDRLTAAAGSHQGFPVVDARGLLLGVVTRRELLDAAHRPDDPIRALVHRTPVVAYANESLRQAADAMVVAGVGRLPVVERHAPRHVVGIITRSDLLAAQRRRVEEAHRVARPTFAG
ncbi:MAG: chloride channel protein [Candidatus Binatia bacterium]